MAGADDFDILAKAKAHFRDQIMGTQRTVEVPEWGLTFYVRPPTLRERSRMIELSRERAVKGMAEILIMRARTGTGAPVFAQTQSDELLGQVASTVLERVGAEVLQFDSDLFEGRLTTPAGDVAANEVAGAEGN